MPTPSFNADTLYEYLYALDTSHLDSLRLSTVVASLLAHYHQPHQLYCGSYQHHDCRVEVHHWVIWDQHSVIDFRRPDLNSATDGVLPWSLQSARYANASALDINPVPMVMLPHYCRPLSAHFDHLASR